jgi:hypothetical protein
LSYFANSISDLTIDQMELYCGWIFMDEIQASVASKDLLELEANHQNWGQHPLRNPLATPLSEESPLNESGSHPTAENAYIPIEADIESALRAINERIQKCTLKLPRDWQVGSMIIFVGKSADISGAAGFEAHSAKVYHA